MATNGPTVPPRGRRRRRQWPLRAKIGLAGIAAVGAAWLIPRGGTAPEPLPTPTPTPPGQLTAAEFPLSTIPAGVSFKNIDGVRVFLVRTGDTVVAFNGVATTEGKEELHWCPGTAKFETDRGGPIYDQAGKSRDLFSARRDLDRVQVLVSAGRVTVFPHVLMPGVTHPPPSIAKGPPPPQPCSAADRVG